MELENACPGGRSLWAILAWLGKEWKKTMGKQENRRMIGRMERRGEWGAGKRMTGERESVKVVEECNGEMREREKEMEEQDQEWGSRRSVESGSGEVEKMRSGRIGKR